MQYDEDKMKSLLKSQLSAKRYEHSLNVAVRAEELAQRFYADKTKARFCGLMHDVCKDLPSSKQLEIIHSSGVELDSEAESTPKLYHAIAGSCFLENELNIKDYDILNAIRYHTTGRAGMSLLEEIIYLADLTSSERNFSDVDRMRKIVNESLSYGMLESLKFTISQLMKKNRTICSDAFKAYNYYVSRTGGGSI